MSSEKATFGLPRNIAAALSYVGLIFTGIVFYIFEREDRFVRFHALQSIIFFGGMTVMKFVLEFIFGILRFIPILGWIFGFLSGIVFYVISVFTLIAWLYLVINAMLGKKFEIPIIGKIVSIQVNK